MSLPYPSWSVVFGEQPTAAKWSELGANDDALAAGTGFNTDAIKNSIIKDPYKFLVTQTAAANTGNGTWATIAFDTEIYDTGGNIAAGVFTAPIAGFYQFNWCISATTSGSGTIIASLYKNGTATEIARGSRPFTATAQILGSSGSICLPLSANDTIRVMGFGATACPLDVGLSTYNHFSGFLVSAT